MCSCFFQVLGRSSEAFLSSTKEIQSVSTIPAPPHASDGFKIDSALFLPRSFFLLVRPVHVDAIVNTSPSRILFFKLAAYRRKYYFFLVHAIGGLGGGRNTVQYSQNLNPGLFNPRVYTVHALSILVDDASGQHCREGGQAFCGESLRRHARRRTSAGTIYSCCLWCRSRRRCFQ